MTRDGTAPATRPGLWSSRDFRVLVAADGASQLAVQLASFTLPLVALLTLDPSVVEVGLLTACLTLPGTLLGIPAGAWVDRRPSRPVMTASAVVRALALCTIPVAAGAGALTMAHLFVVALVLGAATVLFDIAYVSLLPGLVARDQLVPANAALHTVQGLGYAVGPALGGALVQLLTAPVALLGAAAGHGVAAATVPRIGGERTEQTARGSRHLGREIAEGVRFVVAHPLLRRVMACSATLNFFVGLGIPMTVVLLARDLGLDAGTVGLVLACSGVGGIVGSLVVAPLSARLGQGPSIVVGAAVFGVPGLLIPLAQPGPWLVVAAAGLLAGSLGRSLYNVTVLSLRQAVTPAVMMGRVSATTQVLIGGTMPLSNALSGVVAGAIGTRGALWVSAAGATAACLWLLTSPVRRTRTFGPSP